MTEEKMKPQLSMPIKITKEIEEFLKEYDKAQKETAESFIKAMEEHYGK